MKVSFEGAAAWGATVARRVAEVFASSHLYALTAKSYALMEEGYDQGQSPLFPVARPEDVGSSVRITIIPPRMPIETDLDLVPTRLGRSTMGDAAVLGHPDFKELLAEKIEPWQKQPDPGNVARLTF